jgi:hypothetical protein
MRRTWLPLLALATLAIAPLALVRCGPSPVVCDATTCPDGCCGAEGQCLPGNQSNACGAGGQACGDCLAQGTICQQATLSCGTGEVPDAGTDAGTTDAGTDAGLPVDAGTDAGLPDAGTDAGVTCTVITQFQRTDGAAGFDQTGDAIPFDAFAWANVFTQGQGALVDYAWLEIWRDQADEQFPPTPVQRTFSPAVTYATCDVCLGFSEGCEPQTLQNCERHYYAVGGTSTVTEYAQDPAMGAVRATASGVHYQEWNFSTDAPVPGGRCIDLVTLTIDETW